VELYDHGVIFQIILAVVLANLYEWVVHKYILHDLGKKKTFLRFHWSHHQSTRKTGGYDLDYKTLFPLSKEALALLFSFVLHIPLFWFYPYFAGTLGVYALAYFVVHRKAHLDPDWGRKWIPWHFDHHMGKNQDLNWCVLFPMWDHILGTRKKYKINEKKT